MYVLGKAGEEGRRSSRGEKCSGVSSFKMVRWYEYMHKDKYERNKNGKNNNNKSNKYQKTLVRLNSSFTSRS